VTAVDLPVVLPSKRLDVLVADFDTEFVVLVPEQRKAHRLDSGLSLILSSCDGTTTTAALLDEIEQTTGDQRPDLERWLHSGLAELRQLGVFAAATP
jgi:hypothetical protein